MTNLPDSWEEESGFLARFPESNDCDQVIVMLHGTVIGGVTGAAEAHAEHIEATGQEFLQYCENTDTVLILPESGNFKCNGVQQQAWDFTNHFTYGEEVTRLIDIITRIKKEVSPNVWVHGGSGGGFMAWRVAIELERIQHLSMLKGLICTECTSPFSISSTSNAPPVYDGQLTHKEFTYAGFDFYHSTDIKSYQAQLGLSNEWATWDKQTLYQYSPDDETIPTEWKMDFAGCLESKCTDVTVKSSGSGHDLGSQGWTDLVEWLTERDGL